MTTVDNETLCNIIRQNGDNCSIERLDYICGRDVTPERNAAAMAGYVTHTQGRIELTEKGKNLLKGLK